MKVQFGCAPINWTNDDLPSLGGELTYQQCLSEMALAGYKGSEGGARNFNQVMATAADIVIVEAEQMVSVGEIRPENVQTFGILVDYIVDGRDDHG